MDIPWKFRLTFRLGNYIWSLSLWIWTQMRHLGTLIPRFCTEFRYLSYGQSALAWGAIFEKVPKYQETQSFSKICTPIFPGTGSQNEFFPMRPPAATLVGPSVSPDSRVIPEWLVLQYFQIHESYQNGRIFSISRFTSP